MTTYQRMLLNRLFEEIEFENKGKSTEYILELTAQTANARKLLRYTVDAGHIAEALEP